MKTPTKGISLSQQKYEELSRAYDRLKASYIKQEQLLTDLQENFDMLARMKITKIVDVIKNETRNKN